MTRGEAVHKAISFLNDRDDLEYLETHEPCLVVCGTKVKGVVPGTDLKVIPLPKRKSNG